MQNTTNKITRRTTKCKPNKNVPDEITLSPLVTYDVELYLRCAKAVAEQTDKPLVFSISTNLPGYDQIAVKVR